MCPQPHVLFRPWFCHASGVQTRRSHACSVLAHVGLRQSHWLKCAALQVAFSTESATTLLATTTGTTIPVPVTSQRALLGMPCSLCGSWVDKPQWIATTSLPSKARHFRVLGDYFLHCTCERCQVLDRVARLLALAVNQQREDLLAHAGSQLTTLQTPLESHLHLPPASQHHPTPVCIAIARDGVLLATLGDATDATVPSPKSSGPRAVDHYRHRLHRGDAADGHESTASEAGTEG